MRPQSTLPIDDLQSAIQHIWQLEKILDRSVEFGNPAHPVDPADVVLAGSIPAAHNGSPDNIFGSWVEVNVEQAGVPFNCYHNMDLPLVTGEVNVRWIVFGFIHDGTGAGAASTLSVDYQVGDTVTRDMIQLRLRAGGARTISEDHPVRVTLFFTPAVKGSA